MVKKIVVLTLLALVLAFFAGCSTTDENNTDEISAPETSGLCIVETFDIEVTTSALSFKGEVDINSDKTITIRLTDPAELKELTCEIANGTVTVDYHGLKKTVTEEEMPQYSTLLMFEEIVKTIGNQQLTQLEAGGDVSTYEGVFKYGTYTVTADNKTGNVLSIELPEEDTKVILSNHAKPESES